MDVIAVIDGMIECLRNEGFGATEDDEARAAVAKLIQCCDVTINAFEALGRTNGIVDQLEAHRTCERALIEQKAALARVGVPS